MPTGLEQPFKMNFSEMVGSVSRMTKAAAKNSARRKLEKLVAKHKNEESRAVAALQVKIKAAEEARKVANYYAAQGRKIATAVRAVNKAAASPTAANVQAAVRSVNKARSYRRGRFTVTN